MNKAEHARLRKTLEDLDRKSRDKGSGWRFSTSPIVFGVGLGMADYLLLAFVPKAWSTLLPDGVDQAVALQGQAANVQQLSILVTRFQGPSPVAIVVATVVMLIIGLASKPTRFLSWLCALGVIILNVWIVATVLQTSWTANAQAAGLPPLMD